MATTPRKPAAKRAAPKPKAVADAPVKESAAIEPTDKPKVSAERPTKQSTPRTPRAPAKPKADAKPTIVQSKPTVPPKPRPSRRARTSAATVVPSAATAAVRKAREKVAAIPLPDVTPRQVAIVAAGTGGVLAAIGAALFLWRASKADQPNYRVIESEGNFEIREYPALVMASVETHGRRQAALDRGFEVLADYIFAKSRPGEKISMTAPVMSDGSNTSRWRTRFIMPTGMARGDLPPAPAGIRLESEPPRRAAAVRFSGRADDSLLDEKEGALRSWLQLRNLPCEAKAEHAFYNSPMMPGPLRRNEVIVPLSSG